MNQAMNPANCLNYANCINPVNPMNCTIPMNHDMNCTMLACSL